MKKIIFVLFFIIIILGFTGYDTKKSVTNLQGVGDDCTHPEESIKFLPYEDGKHHIKKCGQCGKIFENEKTGSVLELHSFNELGVCSKCNYKIQNCTHKETKKKYIPNLDKKTHRVVCESCNTVIEEAEACSPNQETCEKCSVRKSATFDIPTRVYYIDETGLKAVGSQETNTSVGISLSNVENTPYFSWTMSTTGSRTFNSEDNNSESLAASDGTIKFWYTGNGFDAKLEDKPKNLSGEVSIKITLKVDDVEISQTIKIIKNGIPQSNCTIYLKDENIALDDEKLAMMIRTNYSDFSDGDVRKIREEAPDELPFYTVKGKKVELKSLDDRKLKIESYELKEVTNNTINGYIVEAKIAPKAIGQVKIKYRLTTEYSYRNYETIEKEREGMLIVNILEKPQDKSDNPQGSGSRSSGVGGDSSEDPSGGSAKEKKGASGGLALAGVMGLLIVAIIGSRMMNHR